MIWNIKPMKGISNQPKDGSHIIFIVMFPILSNTIKSLSFQSTIFLSNFQISNT